MLLLIVKTIYIIVFIYLTSINVNAQNTQQTQVTKYFDKRIPDEETTLTDADFQRATIRHRRQVEERFDEKIDDSAMYNKGRFEGDIINPGLNAQTLKTFIQSNQIDLVSQNNEDEDKDLSKLFPGIQRNAVRQSYLKWPNGQIPYTISKQYTSYGIAEAIAEYKTKTCINFRPKLDTDANYVHIFPDDGCYSLVGKVGGKQPVSLGDGCIQKGIIIHELMHAVDRDEYITIKWDNVEAGLQDQFEKYSLTMIDPLGTKYDYGSKFSWIKLVDFLGVMHYGPTAFSRNGLATIVPVQSGVEIGQRVGFSTNDLYKINKLYSFPTTTPKKPLDTAGSNVPDNNVGSVPTCTDTRDDCSFLAGRGHCDSIFSASFMATNCAKSCGRCETTSTALSGQSSGTTPCLDQRVWCSRWAGSGMCSFYIFQPYMQQKCSASCGLC